MEVTFMYAPGDQVRTKLGDDGLIYSCQFGRDGVSYYVQTAGGDGCWFYEDQLEPIAKTKG